VEEGTVALILASMVRLAAPLLLASMGELVSERAGVLNLSVEGMMLTGAFFGAWACYVSGNPWIGLAAAVFAALLLAVIQAVLTVLLHADQIVSGIGLNIMALGGTTLLSRHVFGARSQTQLQGFDVVQIPVLSNLPVLGEALFQHSLFVYLAAAVSIMTAWFLLVSRVGLSITAAGANPVAATRSSVDVRRVRFMSVMYTGALCGLAGAFYSLADIKTFVEGMTEGAGYIALVAVILGNWRPGAVLLACLFFGLVSALRFALPAIGIDVPLAWLGAVPYLAALLAVIGLTGRQRPPASLAMPFK
jgi:general nucleoside transport system permease protein